MPPVVENFEIKKNNFSKILFGALTFLTVVALAAMWDDEGNNKWIVGAGGLLFAAGWILAVKHKIVVYQEGFDFMNFGKSRSVRWQDITALTFYIVYTGHSAEARLAIDYSGKKLLLSVKQYQYKPMQRFFEVLNEQCVSAVKNDHFIKQAKGEMNWRNKLKMY